MTLGNLGALVQNNVKRLLAYSSIAHAGYLLVAFAADRELAISPAMFYAASYAAMNVGAFAVVSHFANAGEKYVTLEDYAGLGGKSPVLAATFTFFLMSLIGIPITGGFFAKFYVLEFGPQVRISRPGDHPRAQQRNRSLLLPAHHRHDVHARTRAAMFPSPRCRRLPFSPWPSACLPPFILVCFPVGFSISRPNPRINSWKYGGLPTASLQGQ